MAFSINMVLYKHYNYYKRNKSLIMRLMLVQKIASGINTSLTCLGKGSLRSKLSRESSHLFCASGRARPL